MRTGNNTTSTQWLYTVANPTPALALAILLALVGAPWQVNLIASPFLILTKIGITGNRKARKRSISKSSPGPDFHLARVRVWAAYYIEQFLHRCLFFLQVPWFGSGKTEWFAGLWGWLGFLIYAIIEKI